MATLSKEDKDFDFIYNKSIKNTIKELQESIDSFICLSNLLGYKVEISILQSSNGKRIYTGDKYYIEYLMADSKSRIIVEYFIKFKDFLPINHKSWIEASIAMGDMESTEPVKRIINFLNSE